jgi:acetyl-CoA C-acetyltransferase
MIPFGEHFELGYHKMMARAYTAAKGDVDHGITEADVDAAWLGTASGTLSNDAEIVSGSRLSEATGLRNVPISRVENACATGSDAVRNATAAIGAGQADVAVVVGAAKMRDKPPTNSWRP